MVARISHTSIDSTDAYVLAQFWAAVLGFGPVPGEEDEPGDEECMIVSPDGGQRLLFIEVPEAKTVKNRIHLDVTTPDVAALVDAGAVVLREPDDEVAWHVLADPDGNEFCAFVD